MRQNMSLRIFVKPFEFHSSFYGNLPLPHSPSRKRSQMNNNEIPIFPNTSRRSQSTMRNKRSITVIEEASV